MSIKLKSLEEFLLEAPVIHQGDAPFETLNNQSISDSGIKDNYTKIAEYNNFDVFKNNKKDYIIVGNFYFDEISKKNRFGLVADLGFKEKSFRSTSKILKGKNAIQIETIHVDTIYRRRNIASFLYKYLLKEYHVLSDKIQYQGAVKLWKSFIKETDSQIYLYDSKEDEIITKISNKTDHNSIWSDNPDYSKHKYQLLMVSN